MHANLSSTKSMDSRSYKAQIGTFYFSLQSNLSLRTSCSLNIYFISYVRRHLWYQCCCAGMLDDCSSFLSIFGEEKSTGKSQGWQKNTHKQRYILNYQNWVLFSSLPDVYFFFFFFFFPLPLPNSCYLTI